MCFQPATRNRNLNFTLSKMNDNDEAAANNTLDNVMINIFTSCDPENTGRVVVSKLMEFISPFMEENLGDLLQLKKALDPLDKNPAVDSKTFYQALSKWTEKIRANTEIDEHNTTPRFNTLIDTHLLQSTPKSVGGCVKERALLSISNISAYSIEDAAGIVDNTPMEEKIKELLYQYRKSTDEVAHLRSQLTLTEDQNEKLQTDLNKVTNKYSRAQLILEELKKEKNEYEDCKESLQVSLKEVKKIERQLVLKEKENGNLYSQIEKLKSEKELFEEKLSRYTYDKLEQMKIKVELQTENCLKDQKIEELTAEILNLKKKIGNLQVDMEHVTYLNEKLEIENEAFTKLLQEKIIKEEVHTSCMSPIYTFNVAKDISSAAEFTPTIQNKNFAFYNYEHPYVRMKHSTPPNHSFNSPRFLHMLANPLSPTLESPIQHVSSYNFNCKITIEQYIKNLILEIVDNVSKSVNLCCTYTLNTNNSSDSNQHKRASYSSFLSNFSQKTTEDNSSEEDVLWKLNVIQNPSVEDSTQKSLHLELSQVANLDLPLKDKSKHYEEVLKLEIDTLRHELATLKEMESMWNKKNESLERKLSSNKVYVTEIQIKLTNFNELEEKCKNQEENLNDILEENSLKFFQIQELQLLLERNNKTLSDLDQANRSLSLDLKQMKYSMEYYKREAAKEKINCEKLKEKIHEYLGNIEMLEENESKKDKIIADLKMKLDYLDKSGNEIDSDYDERKNVEEKSKRSKNRIPKEKLQTCNSYGKLQAKNNKLQQRIDYLQERINNDLKTQIQTLCDEKLKTEETLKLLKSNCDSLEQQLLDVKKEKAELIVHLFKLENTKQEMVSSYESTLEALEEKHKEKHGRILHLETAYVTLLSQKAEIEQTLEENVLKVLSLAEENKKVNQQLSNIKDVQTNLQEQLNNISYKKAELESTKCNLEKKVVNLEKTVKNLAENEILNEDLKNEFQILNEILADVEKSKEVLLERINLLSVQLCEYRNCLELCSNKAATILNMSLQQLEQDNIVWNKEPIMSLNKSEDLDEELYLFGKQINLTCRLLNLLIEKMLSLKDVASSGIKKFVLNPATVLKHDQATSPVKWEMTNNNLYQVSSDPAERVSEDMFINEEYIRSIYIDVISKEATQGLSFSVLERLGLLNEKIKNRKLTEQETEEKISLILWTFSLDKLTLQERYTKQMNSQQEMEAKVVECIYNLMTNVRKQLGSDVSSIEQMGELLLTTFYGFTTEAQDFGKILCEQKLFDPYSIIIEYIKYLKRQLEETTKLYESTKLTLEANLKETVPTNSLELETEETPLESETDRTPLPTHNCLCRHFWKLLLLLSFILIIGILTNTIEYVDLSRKGCNIYFSPRIFSWRNLLEFFAPIKRHMHGSPPH